MMFGSWTVSEMHTTSPSFVMVLLIAGMLTGCKTDGRITDFVPEAFLRKYSEDSAYPNINSVPEKPDQHIQESNSLDPKVVQWRKDLEQKQQALEHSTPPEKRIYNDPKWSLEE